MRPLDLRLCSCGLDLDRCCAPVCPAYEPDRPETQIVVCPKCDGEGRILGMGIVYEPGCGHPHRGEVDHGPCPECDGRGDVEVPA